MNFSWWLFVTGYHCNRNRNQPRSLTRAKGSSKRCQPVVSMCVVLAMVLGLSSGEKMARPSQLQQNLTPLICSCQKRELSTHSSNFCHALNGLDICSYQMLRQTLLIHSIHFFSACNGHGVLLKMCLTLEACDTHAKMARLLQSLQKLTPLINLGQMF